MCDMTMVGIGMMGVSTLMQGEAAKQHGEAVKHADYLSADAAERAAADATERGKLKDLQTVMHGSAVVAEQRVIQSGTGADVNIGGPKATQDATQAISDVDRRVVAYNATMEAYGLRGHARTLRQHGIDAEAEGDNAMVGTFLSGAAKMVGMGGKVAEDKTGGGGPSGLFTSSPGDTSYGGGSEPDEAD